MAYEIKNKIKSYREEEKPLVEFPFIIKFSMVFLFFCLGLSILVLPWFVPVILFLGLCFFIGIILNPLVGIILFLLSAYLHPLTFAPIELVRSHPATVAAFFILIAWGFHVIVYRDFKLPKTSQLFFWFSFLIISIFSAFSHWDQSKDVFLELLKVLIPYFLIVNLIKTKKQFLMILFLILILTLVSAIFGIQQQIQKVGEHISEEMVRSEGLEGNPNYFSMNLVLLVPLTIGLFQYYRSFVIKGSLVAFLLIFIVCIVFTFSRAGMLGLSVVLLISLWRFFISRKQILSITIILIAVTALLLSVPSEFWERAISITDTKDFSIKGRIDGFLVGSRMMFAHPFIGVGMGRWHFEYWPIAFSSLDVETKSSSTSHNVFIEIGSEMGAIALTAFILLLFSAFKDIRKARTIFSAKGDSLFEVISQSLEIGLIGFLVSALFAASTYLKIFWIILGLTVVLREIALQTETR